MMPRDGDVRPNDPHEIFGWSMYDWANSGFQTTVVTALAGPYLTALAQQAVGDNGVVLPLGPFGSVTAKSFFPYCIALSVFVQVWFLPVLGAIADYTHLKKRLMAIFCYAGAAATCLMFFCSARRLLLGGALLIVANVGFGASIVLYNAFLNDVASADRRDAVSSRGFAYGYLGGGLLLAADLGLVTAAPALGISQNLAVRLSLLSAGVWWAGFAIVTFVRLRTRRPAVVRPPGRSYAAIGIERTLDSVRELARLPQTLRFLVAYLFYNDGVQTVISVSAVFLAQELFVARGHEADQTFLMGIILMVQFVAFAGALLYERVAAWIGTKRAILSSVVIWTLIIVYAYRWLETTTEAWWLAAAIAIVLGGSQALSRALFSRMIPAGREASFFGLYEISERGSSWIGPFIFGTVAGATGSYRQAILSVVGLFLAGLLLLAVTDTDRATKDAAAEDLDRNFPHRAGVPF
jgi:MFS transporter, UMF1 family